MVAITWHDTSALIYHTLQPSDGHAPLPPPSPWKPPRSSGLLLHHFANLPPTMRLQYLRLWSLNFPPVSPVHITPTSKACLLGASLTPALSVPGPQLIPHLGPLLLSIQALRFDPSVKVAWVPPANAHFFSCTNQFIMTTFFIALDPVSCLPIWMWASWLWSHIFYSSVVSHAPNQNT